jgi:hypothetical protein
VAWEIEVTDEFEAWWHSLTVDEQESVTVKVDLLAELGPALGRPNVDTLKGTEVPNLKELRIQHEGKPYRVLFAFDPRRVALLLLGGNKTGDNRWYEKAIPIAERLYREHVQSLEKGKTNG